MHTIKKDWVSHDDYIIENFDYNQLTYSDQLFHYRNRSFKEVVFCEGYKGLYNPFFSGIRLAPSKGEVLIVKIPGADFSKMYKDGIFIIPQGNDTYWVGSGYEWNAEDCTPTIKNYEFLSSELKRVLKIPFEIVEHKAAIRPTMHNRRPTLMVNDQYPGMYCFNGLGTKGASIAPFAAHQFTRYIVYKNPQDFIL